MSKGMLRWTICFVLCVCTLLVGQETSDPQVRVQARREFQDAKFGMFIHWGIYSELGAGEWVMEEHHIPIRDYEKLAGQFYPVNYKPAEWVALAKAAGMRYITVTTRHHDGFAMFATKQSGWNVVERTPYARDTLRMLVDECHRQGIKIFFYYSQLDWHHPDYFPRGGTGKTAGRPESGNWERYLDFIDAQLTELLTQYGKVDGIWFDGMWDKPDADWQLQRTYALIHRLQPQALIIPNHHKAPLPGEDVQTFERDLPGENKAGFSGTSSIGTLPLETSDTINKSWGWNLRDDAWKSPKELVGYLVRAAGNNANLLMNVGPMPNGEMPAESVERLRKVGEWMRQYGESVYGTRGGPVRPLEWGATTQKDDRIFVHVLKPVSAIELAGVGRVCSAKRMRDGAKVQVEHRANGVVLQIPALAEDVLDEVIELRRSGCSN